MTQSTEGNITLNFQGTDIHEFIKAILGDVLQLNYMIDPKVAGTVTIETTNPVSNQELLPLIEGILAVNGAVLVNDHGLYRVLPKAGAIKGNLSPTYQSDTTTGGYGVRIIPLTYIAAQEMQKILEPFLPDSSSVRIDPQRNLLILSGTPQELNNLQETVDIFDVDWLRGMSVGLYPLDHVDPKTLKSELDAILADTDGNQGGQLLGGLVRTVAIERLNSILLISSTANALRETELWIYRLDRPGEQVGQRLYVYKLDNAKAVEIAEILGHIFGGSSAKSVTNKTTPSLAPGTTPVEISSGAIPDEQISTESAMALPSSIRETGATLPSNGTVKIIADDVRNALVVMATPSDYKMVEATIKKLDIVPLQILIEASIIEVTLSDDLNYGVEWFFKNNFGSKGGRGTLDLGEAGLAALAPSFSYTIVDSANNVRLALNALAAESSINVLSSPSLMVLDNQTAKINVGDEIPVPTRQSVSNIDPNAPTVNEIQFRKTGVTLTVKPRVNSSGLVTMEIKQEVSNAVRTTTSSLDAPTIQQREIESVVAINSGETIVLGGLIQDSKTNNESGIPGLYKIPLIGKLFGQTTNELRRTELLVLLTPRVVRDKNEARDITDEFRRKLKGIPPLETLPVESDKDKAS